MIFFILMVGVGSAFSYQRPFYYNNNPNGISPYDTNPYGMSPFDTNPFDMGPGIVI